MKKRKKNIYQFVFLLFILTISLNSEAYIISPLIDEEWDINYLLLSSIQENMHIDYRNNIKKTKKNWHIKGLISALSDNDEIIRNNAIYTLGNIGKPAKIAASEIAKLLKNKNCYAPYAVSALCNMGDTAAIPEITKLLKKKHSIRIYAVFALCKIGNKAAKIAIPEISKLFKQDLDIRRFVISCIYDIGNTAKIAVPEISKLLNDDDQDIRYEALKTLQKIGDTSSIPEIIPLLQDKDEDIRKNALSKVGKLSKIAVPKIMELLTDENSKIRCSAVVTLGKIGNSAKIAVPKITKLLTDEDDDVRSSAISALGKIDDAAEVAIPEITKLLKERDYDIRIHGVDNFTVYQSAILALSNILSSIKNITEIAKLLKDKDPYVRSYVVASLGNINIRDSAKLLLPEIKKLLTDDNPDVRTSAVYALREMGDEAIIPEIIKQLTDENQYFREFAVHYLGEMGDAAKIAIPEIIKLLTDESGDVRGSAVSALGKMGDAAKIAIPEIKKLLTDDDPDVRESAVSALGKIGDAAKIAIPEIRKILKSENQSEFVRYWAVDALSKILEPSIAVPEISKLLSIEDVSFSAFQALRKIICSESISEVTKLLTDKDKRIREYASYFIELVNISEISTSLIAELLMDDNYHVRRNVLLALSKIEDTGKLPIPEITTQLRDEDYSAFAAHVLEKIEEKITLTDILYILENCHYVSPSEIHQFRLIAYKLGGGKKDVGLILKWIGIPKSTPNNIRKEDAKILLSIFQNIWNKSKKIKKIHIEITNRIIDVILRKNIEWNKEDLKLLNFYYKNINDEVDKKFIKEQVDKINNKIKRDKWSFLVLTGFGIHLTFWIMMILFYPKSKKMQAILFWNPYVRNILGLGYVSVIILFVPFIRRRLLKPLEEPFIADAEIKDFKPDEYFTQSKVNTIKNIKYKLIDAIPEVKGQILLEGESGLGKTMFLKYLLSKSKRTSIYLRANRCKNGVINGIKEKIHSIEIQDTKLLNSLIYSGSFDIFIDGLNEVNAKTRLQITNFVEKYFRTNIILTSQPLEWIIPVNITKYELLPLEQENIENFLINMYQPSDNISKEQYVKKCKKYLSKALSIEQSENILYFIKKLHSNPMDLSVISEMLINDIEPDPFQLQKQQYDIMAKKYKVNNINKPFPLKEFSEYIYQLRLNNNIELSYDTFPAELLCMERFKMVLFRRKTKEEDDLKKYYFRHDKIMDFFIAQTFQGESNEKIIEHLNDPRFRGVYFLLAYIMDIKDAKMLREKIIMNAAKTNNNTVSNKFILLLNSRENIENMSQQD